MNLNADKFHSVMQRVADALNADPHHRLLSWDHAWEHWNSFSEVPEGDETLAALHLAFYLASWGMYRGSSDLLYRDFKVLIPTVHFLKKEAAESEWEDCMFSETDIPKLAAQLKNLGDSLGNTLKEKLARPDKEEVNVSDTLRSKILLNTLGCVPAFDTEVKGALRDILGRGYPTGNNAFDAQRLKPTISLARANAALIKQGQVFLENETGKKYPLTKVLDLYLWHHGFDLPKKTQ
jgi:hypothetical protein